jgi:hypothetical protein
MNQAEVTASRTLNAAKPTAVRFQVLASRPGIPGARVNVAGKENSGFASASANFAAVSNRSAASFCNAFTTAAATLGGTVFRTFVTGAGSSVTIFEMICCALLPICGGSPVSISYSTAANE